MRIATYNVNGINGRLANLLGWLQEAAPDIVCLQELKAPDDKFPSAALRAAGYGAIWHGQKSWNGVAILARGADPVETHRGLPGDSDDMAMTADAAQLAPGRTSKPGSFLCAQQNVFPDTDAVEF